MDFYKTKQPIALPLDSEDEKLLKENNAIDPELAVGPPQQECGRRCCFKKGSRGRKAIRLVGHFLVLGAFFYWFSGPSIKFYRGGHELNDIQLPDFTDIDEIPSTIPEDFLMAPFDSDEKFECDKYAVWSEPEKIKHPCRKGHHGHRKPHKPDEPEPPHHPDRPEPHHPSHPGPHHHPDHPHKPDHPHEPDHPHKPHHPHKPGPPHRGPRGPKYTTNTTFKLPLSDSALLFFSHGPFARGGIKFYQDDSDSLNPNEVEVTINAKIWNKKALDLTKVCTLKREDGAGLGIWTEPVEHKNPKERKKREIIMRISVKFPKHPNVLELEKLQTHMPLFAHFFKDANLKIKNLEATSFFFPIGAEALNVGRGKIKTENNVIVGNFTAAELLVLETKNSPIIVNATLVNDPAGIYDDEGDEHGDFSKLFIKTSNSPVHANISLHAATKSHTGGKFLVGAFTSNSPLHVSFADAPVDSTLRFKGFTSNFPAVASLHPTYEGDFVVKSTLFGPKVHIREGVPDPEGKGRERTLDVSKSRREIVGKVYWGSEEEGTGRVELGSTLLPAILKL